MSKILQKIKKARSTTLNILIIFLSCVVLPPLRPRRLNQILKKIVTRYYHVFRYINKSNRFFICFNKVFNKFKLKLNNFLKIYRNHFHFEKTIFFSFSILAIVVKNHFCRLLLRRFYHLIILKASKQPIDFGTILESYSSSMYHIF